MRVERKRTERRSGESGWDGELAWLAVAESRDNRKKMPPANGRLIWRHTNPHGHPAPSTMWILYPSSRRAKYRPWGGKYVLFSGDIGITRTYIKKVPPINLGRDSLRQLNFLFFRCCQLGSGTTRGAPCVSLSPLISTLRPASSDWQLFSQPSKLHSFETVHSA